MTVHAALRPALHLITGKGGVGRTSVAISLAKAFMLQGEQVLLLEARDEEGGASSLGRALGVGDSLPSATLPKRLSAELIRRALSEGGQGELTQGRAAQGEGALYAGQLIAREGHEGFLSSLLPVERLVKAALQSQGLSRFLTAAPSMYELGLFYHLWSVVEGERFTKVVMDLPATGHTLALTRLPGQIERMVPIGPVTEGLRRGKQVICDPEQASVWVVAIPEQLPVSEALDLSVELGRDELKVAAFVLNRSPFKDTPPEELKRAGEALALEGSKGALSALIGQLERAKAAPRLTSALAEVAPVFMLDEAVSDAERTRSLMSWFEGGPATPPQRSGSEVQESAELASDKRALLLERAMVASARGAREGLREALLSRKVIVCCGSGGVGKTTSSAALALAAAQLGRQVLVLTIDPSKRLAEALGVSRNTPRPVSLSAERLRALGVSAGGLSAWLLDPREVSDGVVRREAGAEASKLMSNMIYKEISGMVAGMQEYTAVEALRTFVLDASYDLVVLDTPPARHALRFLDAPERVAGFLDKRIFKLFVPDRGGLMGRIAGRVIDEVLERAFGQALRDELKQFFELFSQILDHLNGNQQVMKAFFRSPDIGFYLVTSAHEEVIQEASYFRAQVEERGLSFGGVILNRDPLGESAEPLDLAQLLQGLSPELRGHLQRLYQAERERLTQLSELIAALSDQSKLIRVPDLGPQASRLEGLASLARALSGAEGERHES